EAGYHYMWPGEPLKLGRAFEINDHRAVVVGICKASSPYVTQPVIYTRYSQAEQFALSERKLMPYILVHQQTGTSPRAVCRRIQERTGLMALTQDEFAWKTIFYYIGSTGIPVNFGITVLLGFIVGVAVAGQTFYLFTLESLKQFGALKA